MIDPRLDPREHITPIRARVDEAVAPQKSYDWGQVPGETGNQGVLPSGWVLPDVERRYNDSFRADQIAAVTLWRAGFRIVGGNPYEVRRNIYRIETAFSDETLEIAGLTTTPWRYEGPEQLIRDGNTYHQDVAYTYAL